MRLSLDTLQTLAEVAIRDQEGRALTGRQKQRRAVEQVIRGLDNAIQWPGPVGRLIDLIDGPVAIFVAHIVQDLYEARKRRRR